MMLRILLVVIIAGAVGLGGCKKKEPTIGERVDQMKEDAEKAADEAQPAVEEAVKEAEKATE